MKNIYTLNCINDMLDLYNKTTHGNYDTYIISGCLCDNYILTGENLKTTIIKEYYLNEWSSGCTIRSYKKMPKKYEKVIELLEDEKEQEASDLFFN